MLKSDNKIAVTKTTFNDKNVHLVQSMIVDALKCLSKMKQWSTSAACSRARTIKKYMFHCHHRTHNVGLYRAA